MHPNRDSTPPAQSDPIVGTASKDADCSDSQDRDNTESETGEDICSADGGAAVAGGVTDLVGLGMGSKLGSMKGEWYPTEYLHNEQGADHCRL